MSCGSTCTATSPATPSSAGHQRRGQQSPRRARSRQCSPTGRGTNPIPGNRRNQAHNNGNGRRGRAVSAQPATHSRATVAPSTGPTHTQLDTVTVLPYAQANGDVKVLVTAWSHPTTAATKAQLPEVRSKALAQGAA